MNDDTGALRAAGTSLQSLRAQAQVPETRSSIVRGALHAIVPSRLGSHALAASVGAVAFGAVAVGALAIARLRVGNAAVGELRVERLIVHQIQIETWIGERPA